MIATKRLTFIHRKGTVPDLTIGILRSLVLPNSVFLLRRSSGSTEWDPDFTIRHIIYAVCCMCVHDLKATLACINESSCFAPETCLIMECEAAPAGQSAVDLRFGPISSHLYARRHLAGFKLRLVLALRNDDHTVT